MAAREEWLQAQASAPVSSAPYSLPAPPPVASARPTDAYSAAAVVRPAEAYAAPIIVPPGAPGGYPVLVGDAPQAQMSSLSVASTLLDKDALKEAMDNIDKTKGYLGIFVKQADLKKQDLKQFVNEIEDGKTIAEALSTVPAFKLDVRYEFRHRVQHWGVELLGFLLSIAFLVAVKDVSSLEQGPDLPVKHGYQYWLALCVFIVSWSFHGVIGLILQWHKCQGPAGIASVDEDADEEEDLERTSVLRPVTRALPESAYALPASAYAATPMIQVEASPLLSEGAPSPSAASVASAMTRVSSGCDYDEEDVEEPATASAFEEEASTFQILLILQTLTLFVQYFIYLALFAFCYPSYCPTERGPYSCRRMNYLKNHSIMEGASWVERMLYSGYEPPRYTPFNSTYPLFRPESDRVPHGMATPYILNDRKGGKEVMSILAHCVPILYALYWIVTSRRLSNLLVQWADQLVVPGEESLTEEIEKRNEERQTLRASAYELQKKKRPYRRALMYLAMVYHTMVPHFQHIFLRFGSLLLDLIDVQDFWLLLVDFDLYEGRDIREPYFSWLGFNLCALNSLDEVHCSVSCDSAATPDWWKPYEATYSPCKMLADAYGEWKVSNRDIWGGALRGEEIYYYIFPFLDKSRKPFYHFISWWYFISAALIITWPVLLYFRHNRKNCCGGRYESPCCRKCFKTGRGDNRAHALNVDNRESLWNAYRALLLNVFFLFLRFHASMTMGIVASSLLIKNVLVIITSCTTIWLYFLWSWSNPNKWPYMRTSRGLRSFCNRCYWCGIDMIPKSCWLYLMTWWQPKPLVYRVEKSDKLQYQDDELTDELKSMIGKEDDGHFFQDLTMPGGHDQAGRKVLKAGRDFILLPGASGIPTRYDQTEDGAIDQQQIAAEGKCIRHEDIFVEENWASDFRQKIS